MVKTTFVVFVFLISVAVAQQQPKPGQTILYFKKDDPKYGEILAALADEPKCATVDVNVLNVHLSGFTTDSDTTHKTWWLLASPKEYNGYKKYRYNYVLEPPGTLTEKDLVIVVSDKTVHGIAERICSQVTGTPRGARIHME